MLHKSVSMFDVNVNHFQNAYTLKYEHIEMYLSPYYSWAMKVLDHGSTKQRISGVLITMHLQSSFHSNLTLPIVKLRQIISNKYIPSTRTCGTLAIPPLPPSPPQSPHLKGEHFSISCMMDNHDQYKEIGLTLTLVHDTDVSFSFLLFQTSIFGSDSCNYIKLKHILCKCTPHNCHKHVLRPMHA